MTRDARTDQLYFELRKTQEALEIVQTKFHRLAVVVSEAIMQERDHLLLTEIDGVMQGMPKPEWVLAMRETRDRLWKEKS